MEGLMLLLSAAMMSWARVWVDLDLFTTQFSDKMLRDTWKSKLWEGFGWFCQIHKVKVT